MKTSLTASAKRLRAMILGCILLILVVLTLWMFAMVAANFSPTFEAIEKRDRSNWWIPILPQMNIAIG